MNLPIDFKWVPIKYKYIFEETRLLNVWCQFGIHPTTGNVDIADPEGDIFTNVPKEKAEQILAARDAFIAALEAILCRRS